MSFAVTDRAFSAYYIKACVEVPASHLPPLPRVKHVDVTAMANTPQANEFEECISRYVRQQPENSSITLEIQKFNSRLKTLNLS